MALSIYTPKAVADAISYYYGYTPETIRTTLRVFLRSRDNIVWKQDFEAPAAITLEGNPKIIFGAKRLTEMALEGLAEWAAAGRTDEDMHKVIITNGRDHV